MVYSGKVLRSLQSLRQLSQVVKKWREQHAATMNNAESTQEKWNNYSARIKNIGYMYISGFFILFYFSLSLTHFIHFFVVVFLYIRGSSIRSKLETWWHCHQKIFCVLFLPILSCFFLFFVMSWFRIIFISFLYFFFVIITDSNKKKFMYWNYLSSWLLLHLHLDFLEEFLSSSLIEEKVKLFSAWSFF